MKTGGVILTTSPIDYRLVCNVRALAPRTQMPTVGALLWVYNKSLHVVFNFLVIFNVSSRTQCRKKRGGKKISENKSKIRRPKEIQNRIINKEYKQEGIRNTHDLQRLAERRSAWKDLKSALCAIYGQGGCN